MNDNLRALLNRATKTRRRRVGVAAFLAAVTAGVIVGALAGIGGAADPRSEGLLPHMQFADVVAKVQRSFGDRRIVSASIDGLLLSVKLNLTRHSNQAAQMKGVFEAQVLGHAVADWMRFQGHKPITGVDYSNTQGKAILGYGVDRLEADPSVSSLSAAACKSAARPAAKGLLRLGSAQTLPYLHGTCVFIFRTAKPVAGSGEAMGALGRIIHAIGPPNERPWFFELVTRSGAPLSSAAWMPDAGGTTWAKPGYAYALAHG